MSYYKCDWTHSDTACLIKLYEAAPALWDVREEDYRNKVRKRKAYEAIAKEFSTSIPEVKRKLHNLRSQWQVEVKKIKGSLENGDEELYVPTWWCFESLNFLASPNMGHSETLAKRKAYLPPPTVKQETEPKISLVTVPISDGDTPSRSESESPKPVKKKKKSNKRGSSEANVPAASNDDDQIFMDYVASVMRNMSDVKKKQLRRKIQVAILEVEWEEDSSTANTRPRWFH